MSEIQSLPILLEDVFGDQALVNGLKIVAAIRMPEGSPEANNIEHTKVTLTGDFNLMVKETPAEIREKMMAAPMEFAQMAMNIAEKLGLA